MSDTKPRSSINLASDFLFGELRADHKVVPVPAPPPPLGPLAAFVGDFVGNGFNTIFRPDSAASPTTLPNPVPPAPPHDNILELNLTSETLSFSKSLGSVPNRGTGAQKDAFLNGVPYVQSINDTTIHGEKCRDPLRARHLDSCTRDNHPTPWGNRHAHGIHSPRHDHRCSGSCRSRKAWAANNRSSGYHANR